MKRRLLALLGFSTGVLAGSVVLRRQFGRRRDRVDLYFDDGSMVSYADGSAEASPLLDAAHEALDAARSS